MLSCQHFFIIITLAECLRKESKILVKKIIMLSNRGKKYQSRILYNRSVKISIQWVWLWWIERLFRRLKNYLRRSVSMMWR
jgi:hypothetical protein